MLDADDHDVFAWRLDALERIARRDGPSLTTAHAFVDAWTVRHGSLSGARQRLEAVIEP